MKLAIISPREVISKLAKHLAKSQIKKNRLLIRRNPLVEGFVVI